MAEAREGPITLLAMGDELLLSIMELLCMADVLSCSLVNSRLHSVAEAAFIPFRLALKRYGLRYHPYNSASQSTPDRALCDLLDSIHKLNKNWLHLTPTSSCSFQISDALDDLYFFHDYALVDRLHGDEDDDEGGDEEWEIEVYKYGDLPVEEQADPKDPVLEVEEDGTVVEEIDAESHGIDVNALETDEEDDGADEPENSGSGSSEEESDSDEDVTVLETEGVHSVGQFRTNNSFISSYKVDIAQDLIVTSERWLKSKVKKSARRPARLGLNFSRDTHFLRCLTVRDLKPHPACKSHLGTINIQYLCTNNKEDYDEPEDIRIQGPLVSFALKHTLVHKVVIVDWREPLRARTIMLEKEFYLDMHFVSNETLVILSCPITDTDLIRRSLDDENYPVAPREGKIKLHIYHVGPSKSGMPSPCLVRTLVYPLFNDRWRIDIESAKILPQISEASSRPIKDGLTVTDGLPYQTSNEAGVFGTTFSGMLLKRQLSSADDENDEELGTGWVIDLVVLKSRILDIAGDAIESKQTGGELSWKDWAGENGEHVRIFPHSDEGWMGSPKLYEAVSYRVASITPLKRGELGNEVYGIAEETRERKNAVQADRRMDVLDFCPGRLEDVQEALEAKRRQREQEDSCPEGNADEGMFGVAAGALLDGEGSEITLVDAQSTLEGGPFRIPIKCSLPYILSRFDLDRGRKDDGTLPLPESLWMTETEIIIQIEPTDEEGSLCPAFDRYSFL